MLQVLFVFSLSLVPHSGYNEPLSGGNRKGKELHRLRINNALDEPFTLELLRWLDVEADSCLEKFI